MNNSLQLFSENKKPKLNEGQKAFLALVEDCFKKNKPITHDEIREIYLTKVSSHVIQYWCWNQATQKNEYWTTKRSDWDIDTGTQNWIVSCIGRLVRKGYLTVIPTIQFKQLEAKCPKDQKEYNDRTN